MGTLYWIGFALMLFGFFGWFIPLLFEMEVSKGKIFLIIEAISAAIGLILFLNS